MYKAQLEALYRENTGLLYRLARRYRNACQMNRAVSEEDLIQAGFLGLAAALESFDPACGMSWAGWAALYIKRKMRAAVGLHTGARKAYLGAVSLDEPLGTEEDAGDTRSDLLADDSLPDSADGVLLDELQATVHRAVEAIPDTGAWAMIVGHRLEGRAQKAVGAALGVSGSAAHNLERKGLNALRKNPELIRLAREYHLDQRTDFYRHTGLSRFHRTWNSATEEAALWRLEMQKKYGLEDSGNE